MENTPLLGLPYIMPNQAQKHVTHNEAIRMLDALTQIAVESRTRTHPPEEPEEGRRYIIPSAATGEWNGKENQIAAFQDGAWSFHSPRAGWLAFERGEARLLAFDGEEWNYPDADPDKLGVNAQADEFNRLFVKSDSALFSHDDATPGSGDVRLTLNKKQESATASLVFQNQWSGRAEFGLAGNDRWSVKVSPNGNDWKEALACDPMKGTARFPNGIVHDLSGARPEAMLAVPEEKRFYHFDHPRDATRRKAAISSVEERIIVLQEGNSHHLFASGMEGIAFARIWNVSLSPRQSAWAKASPAGNRIEVIDKDSIAEWKSGQMIQLGDHQANEPPAASWVACDVSPMMQEKYGRPFKQTGVFVRYSVRGVADALSSNQAVSVGISPTDQESRFCDAHSRGHGGEASGILYSPCSVKSPISDSNLIFVREIAEEGAMKTASLWLTGLFAPM